MFKNFAAQTSGTIELNGLDLGTEITPTKNVFDKRTLFLDNCNDCGMKNFASADGDGESFWSGINANTILGLATTGASVWSQQQQSANDTQQAELALQIENQRLQQERARAQAEAAKAASAPSKIKAYIVPIAVTGALVIAGIGAYFYFKKKKIS
jgi:hypothetical protein